MVFTTAPINFSTLTVLILIEIKGAKLEEVCFKECKQLLDLGKDQSNNFDAQVFATTASFLKHNILSFLNETENYSTLVSLFEHLADDSAVISPTVARRFS
ncbi:MAG: hypothetical protein JRD93_12330 [Deltaproteobacteria bacterium]|nr:hypothetical protein [Deltaproteobacteria bacterium]